MKIGCLGMATLDTLLFTKDPIYAHEAVTPVEEAVVSPGGKGIVSAMAMQRAGADVLPFALIGSGPELATLLPDEIERRYLLPLLESDSRTWITISEAHKVVTFVSHAPLDGAAEEAAIGSVQEFISQVNALYVTIEHPPLVRAALRASSASGIKLALNPSVPLLDLFGREDPRLLGDLVANCTFILCNDWEAPQFLRALGVKQWSDLEAPLLEEVVVTAGAAGGQFAVAPFESWERFDATPVERLRCVVGAGDTFNGAYLAARLVNGASPRASARRGADLAAAKVAYRGSLLPVGGTVVPR